MEGQVAIPGANMKSLDLGAGGIKRVYQDYEYYGCDLVSQQWENFKQVDLSLDPIPWTDDCFDIVTAYDFLEHLPSCVYMGRVRTNPLINIFNEAYRVLNDRGLFVFQVPTYPSEAAFQDPTHLNFWVPERVNYFSGDYYGFHDHYGHTSRFEKASVDIHPSCMIVTLKAIKNLGKDEPYRLTY